MRTTCAQWHTIVGTLAMRRTFPDLTHLTNRKTTAAGLLRDCRLSLTAKRRLSGAMSVVNQIPSHLTLKVARTVQCGSSGAGN